MELDIRMGDDTISITIRDPYRPDLSGISDRIRTLLAARGGDGDGPDVDGLIPLMIRGVVGCEEGCPANAKELVERGYKDFSLEYIEGGILQAVSALRDGRVLSIRLFPDF
jgi:hypothetical protein